MWSHLPTGINRRRTLRIVAAALLFVALTTTSIFSAVTHATAGINKTVNFQGRLLNAAGATVADGYYNIQFKIYQDGDGLTAGDTTGSPSGSLKWTETYINNNVSTGAIKVQNGFFSVNLGSKTAFGSSVDWNQDTLYLSMNVAGSAVACTTFGTAPCSADGEMLPMKQMTASPYAMNAGQLGGLTSSNFVQLAQGVQTDATTNSSIFINKSSTGNLIELQKSSGDVFTVGNAGDLTLGNNADHTISVTATASTAGKSLTMSAGAAGTGGSALAGGNIVLQGGAGGGTNGNGGDVSIDAGIKNGSGADGNINIGATHATTITIGNTTTGSSTAIKGGGYTLTTQNTGVTIAGSGTGNSLSVSSSANPSGGTNAIIVGNNTNGSASGNLIALQNGGVNKFTVDASGNTAASGTLKYADSGTATTSLVCKDASGFLNACSTTGNGAAFIQGGNNFGGDAVLGATQSGQQLTFKTGGTNRLTLDSTGANLTFLQAASINTSGATSLTLDTGGAAALNLGNTNATTIQIGSTSGTLTQTINLGTNNTASSTTNVTIGAGSSAAGGTTDIRSKGNTTLSTNGTTRATFDTSGNLYVGDSITSGSTGTFTIQGSTGAAANTGYAVALQGGTGGSGTGYTGGALNLTGGTAGGTNGNGGDVTIAGGAKTGSGTAGKVNVATGGTTRAVFDTSGNLYLGNGTSSTSPTNFTVRGTDSSLTGTAGGTITIQGGAATTGNANGGDLGLQSGNKFGSGTDGTINIGTANIGTVQIGSTTASSGTQLIKIGNNTTVGSRTDITLGSTIGGSTTTIQGGSGGIQLTGDVSGSTTINAVSGFKFNGTAGSTTTCSGGQVIQNQVIQGGITTGGTCTSVGGGSSNTLQDSYNNYTSSAIITLNSTAKGIWIRDAASTVGGNLFAVQNNTGSGNSYFAVTTSGASVAGTLTTTGTINTANISGGNLSGGTFSGGNVSGGTMTTSALTFGTATSTVGLGAQSGSTAGGNLQLQAGQGGSSSGAGGDVVIQGGNAGGGNAAGGNLTFDAGIKQGTGVDGNINIGANHATNIQLGTAGLFNVNTTTGIITSADEEKTGALNTVVGGIGQYQNLLLKSEDFSTTWGTTDVTVTANDGASNPAPDGQTTADKLVSGTGGSHVVTQSYSTATNGNYTFSVWVKSNSGSQPFSLRIDSTGATPTSGTATSYNATTTWQRFVVTQNFTGTPSAITPTIVFTNNSETIVAWGGQLVTGTKPLVYVRTAGTAVTGTNYGIVDRGSALFQSAVNSSTAFQVQDASQNNMFTIDTSGDNITVGNTTAALSQTINIGSNNTASSTTNVNIGAGSSATGGTTNIQSKGDTTFTTNGTARALLSGSGNTLYLGNANTSGQAGTANAFTIQGTASTTSNVQGGSLTLQAGAATAGNANGGNLTLNGGAGVGTGAAGLVIFSTPTFSTSSSDGNCYISGADVHTSCTITSTSVNGSSAIIVGFDQTGQTATLPDPTVATAGRIIYITASVTSSDFTLSVNGGGTGNTIAMRKNTTATMIWNGSDWTAAGASSSTTLQSAYDNTLQSAGGAELIVSKTSATNGLTIRDSSTNSVNGALLSVQGNTAANLFSVSSNLTEYASDPGGETAGSGGSTTFPSTTWAKQGNVSVAVSRDTTTAEIATGQASAKVITTANANDGINNTLTSALTVGLTYNVSFTALLSSGTFNDLTVDYSKDGTTTGNTSCASAQQIVTKSWTKISCSFTVPSGANSSNAIFIRQATGTVRTFYVDNLSVTAAASQSYVTDGGVDDNTNFATNYVLNSGATVARSTTVGNDASDSVQITTNTSAASGVKNKLAVSPLASTGSTTYLYRVTAYVQTTVTALTAFKVQYSRDNGTNFVDCVDYNTQAVSVSSLAFTKITCIIQTDTTAASNPYLYFEQGDTTARTSSLFVDTMSMTIANSTTPDVQIGGGINGGPTTLFTLDKGAGAPIAGDNQSLLGSMYYDTVIGKIQCYQAAGWGSCGSAPDSIITISPEYTNAVMHGTGVGTMTSDFCSGASGININDGTSGQATVCGSSDTYNFYKWTSPQSTSQPYSIYVTYQLPSTFKAFTSGSTSLQARVDNTTNASVKMQIYKNHSGMTTCGGDVTITSTPNTWQFPAANGTADPSTCGFVGGDSIVFKITMRANSNANAYIGNIGFTFSNK